MIDNHNNLIGKVLDSYRLEEQIGQGGNAVVYRAWQENLSRNVAVKVLRLPEIGDARLHSSFLARFKQEASVVATFNHINIMPVYDFGEQDGLMYLVMPLFDKGSLRDILDRRGFLTLQESGKYLEQAAAALDYAHKHRVIHRDLKPGNFLIHNDGRLVLTDFGIAHLMKESMSNFTLTNTGMVLGTPDYMAPEMIQGQYVDHRADIYELGIVLYQMLSGDVPFRGENTYAILLKHINDSLPLLHRLDPAIPSAVDDVLQKATAKHRDERFASAGEFAQAFHRAINPYPPVVIDSYAPTILPPQIPVQSKQPGYGDDAQTVSNMANDTPKVVLPSTVYVPPLYPTPTVALQNSRRSPVKLISFWLILCLLVLIGAVSVPSLNAMIRGYSSGGSSTGTSKPTATPGPTQPPTVTYASQIAVVKSYYGAFKQRDYTTAYNLSHTDTANPNSDAYCGFVKDYAGMLSNTLSIDSVEPLNDVSSTQRYGTNAVRVDITITATEMDAQGDTRVSVYQQYQVVRGGKIVGGDKRNSNENGMVGTPTVTAPAQPITMPVTTDSLSQQVQEVIQEQYDYLNRKDYQDAYNMWSKQYQSITSFCSFLLDHVRVQLFTVQVGTVSDPGDGTEDAPVTVTETVAGTNNAPYNMTYYVAPQNNLTWEIMQTVNTN